MCSSSAGLPRPLDGVATEAARARARCRHARGRPRRPRAERPERRLRLDALGRPADPARPCRRRARGRGLPRLRARGARDRCVLRRAGRRRAATGRRGTLHVATTEAQVGDWDELVEACEAVGAPDEARPLSRDEVAARCASPALPRRRSCSRRPRTCNPRGSPSGSGAAPSSAASASTSARRVQRLAGRGARGRARGRSAPTRRCSPSTAPPPGSAASALRSRRLESHRPHRAGPGRHRGARLDGRRDDRRQPHDAPLPPDDADGRIAFGWGGGRMGFGGRHRDRLDLDAERRSRRAQRSRCASSRSCATATVTHAWGGPIDVSPTHLPIFGSRGRVHHGYGFTGNGVGPSYLGGEILARLALDRRDETDAARDRRARPQALPARAAALARRHHDQDRARPSRRRRRRGATPDPLTGFVSSLPRRLGLRLPR